MNRATFEVFTPKVEKLNFVMSLKIPNSAIGMKCLLV